MSFLKNLFRTEEKGIRTYAEFWHWFAANAQRFHAIVKTRDSASIERELFPILGTNLDNIKDGIAFLTGMLKDGETAELILTADGNAKNIVFVEELVAAAPEIDGWVFTALKQPSGETFELRMNGYVFSADSMWFFPNDNPDQPDLVDITVVHEAFDREDDHSIKSGAYIFVENFLGELAFLENVDELSFAGPSTTERDLIPLEALNNFLDTRRALFVEKYNGVRIFTENDEYASFQGTHDDGSPIIAVMNTSLLRWDAKASHPWMLVVTVGYEGSSNNGMPDKETYEKLDELEDSLTSKLKDIDGYLNIGRQTARGERIMFFACIDFRKPSKVVHEAQNHYRGTFEIDFEIYKDKYWQSVGHFAPTE